MVFDGATGRVGILDDTPSYPFDVGANTNIQGTFRVTGGTTLLGTCAVTGLLSNTGGAKLEIQGAVDGGSTRGIFMWDTTSTSWGIYVAQSGAGKSLADGVACTDFSGSTGHHFRFRIADTADRSFVWENSSEVCLMDLEADTGNLRIAGIFNITKASTLLIDLDPGFTGTGEVINITPSDALDTEDAEWDGINIVGNALSPSVIGAHLHGIHLDFSTVDMTEEPHIDALHIEVPRTSHIEQVHAIHANHGMYLENDLTTLIAGMAPTFLNVSVDDEGATGGDAHILDVARAGGGTLSVVAVATHTGVGVIHQHVGVPANFDNVWRFNGGWTDATAQCGGVGDIALWEAQDDVVYFGEATTFDEIECIWTVLATKSMHFQFHYSDGAAGWVRFYPTDDTGGAQLNGVVHWLASDIPAWATDTVNGVVNKYWIRVTRTRLIGTGPTESTIKFIKGVSYGWDELGNITALTATLPNEGLRLLDTGGDHYLTIKPGSNLGANRILTITTGDAARTITLLGNPTLDDWFDQAVKQASSPSFAGVYIKSSGELRFYDNGNYVGFEAPALSDNQIWVLPDEDGDNLDFLQTDGAGNLAWAAGGGGAGDVTAAAVLADHTLIRGDGGAKGIQDSGIDIDDADNITLPDGASINLQEDITFLGATSENQIKFPDALADALSFLEGANPYQTFITTDGSEAIQFHEEVLLKGSTEYGAGNKTTGAWAKSIGATGDYADWATMIAAMPDLIAHAVTVTIEAGTTLTETCNLRNKHGLTSIAIITIQAEKYFPTAGAIPTADSATATTLRDAALAAAALGNDYFNGCWVFIVDGTGTDNGYVPITDYIDATGDVVVGGGWPGTQPDNTSRYIIVGALIDGGSARAHAFVIENNTAQIKLRGIGVKDTIDIAIDVRYCFFFDKYWGGVYNSSGEGIYLRNVLYGHVRYSGVVGNGTNGISCVACEYADFEDNGISDNTNYGITIERGSYAYVGNNFGDGNGTWGTFALSYGQVRFGGTECSGSEGNHKYADGDFNVINLEGGQIAFPATAVPSANANTLDDYEEGTFTPYIYDGLPGDQGGAGNGYYTKIGNMVYVDIIFLNIDKTGLADFKQFYIRELPFTVAVSATGAVYSSQITINDAYLVARAIAGTTYCIIWNVQNGGVGAQLTVATINDDASDLEFSIAYRIA